MKTSTLFDGFILSILIVLLIVSRNYPFQLKLLPWIFIPLGIILLSIQMVKDLKTETAGVRLSDWIAAARGGGHRYVTAVLWIAGLFIFFYLVGFVIAAPVFTILFLRAGGERWRYSVCLSVIVWGIFLAIFTYGMHVQLYEGMLYQLFFS